jgi:hypothetical protein
VPGNLGTAAVSLAQMSMHDTIIDTFSRVERQIRRYGVYGVVISSELPLPLTEIRDDQTKGICEIAIRAASGTVLNALREDFVPQNTPFPGFAFGETPDGSNYIRWEGLGEILVSKDGASITCRPFPQTEPESFHVYLLGQALSFALVKMGFEPLHATAVAVGDQAVAFVGDCGFGKSTLAASFLEAGHRLLTDDLLLLRAATRELIAYPGPARIKLFPKIAEKFLGQRSNTVALNPQTRKQIIPLNERQICTNPMPLRVVYTLAPSKEANGKGIHILKLSKRESFVTLVGATFNRMLVDRERLQRQFHAVNGMVSTVIVKKAFYPRILSSLSQVREAIVSDACTIEPEPHVCEA